MLQSSSPVSLYRGRARCSPGRGQDSLPSPLSFPLPFILPPFFVFPSLLLPFISFSSFLLWSNLYVFLPQLILFLHFLLMTIYSSIIYDLFFLFFFSPFLFSLYLLPSLFSLYLLPSLFFPLYLFSLSLLPKYHSFSSLSLPFEYLA